MNENDLDRWFAWKPPRDDQADAYTAVRSAEAAVSLTLGHVFQTSVATPKASTVTRAFARVLLQCCPDSPERDEAMKCIREVRYAMNEWLHVACRIANPQQRQQAHYQLYTLAANSLNRARWWAIPGTA